MIAASIATAATSVFTGCSVTQSEETVFRPSPTNETPTTTTYDQYVLPHDARTLSTEIQAKGQEVLADPSVTEEIIVEGGTSSECVATVLVSEEANGISVSPGIATEQGLINSPSMSKAVHLDVDLGKSTNTSIPRSQINNVLVTRSAANKVLRVAQEGCVAFNNDIAPTLGR